MLPPLRPMPLKEREPMVFLEYGQLDVLDGAFVLVDASGVRTQIPVGGLACIMLQPGTRVSHAAAVLAARCGTLLIWVGEAGVRLYASGQPGGARSDRLLYQARLALDADARLRVVRHMFTLRFGGEPPARRSVDQLRGIEGVRVRELYKQFAKQYGVQWKGRRYDPRAWGTGDVANRCVSAANACLYGITEAAVLAAGYAPALGFLHTGKPLSFVYDMADIVKFEVSVPVAFKVAAEAPANPESAVRRELRDAFRKTRILARLIPMIEEVLNAGGLDTPAPAPDMVPPAIPEPEPSGDAGHRG